MITTIAAIAGEKRSDNIETSSKDCSDRYRYANKHNTLRILAQPLEIPVHFSTF